LTVALLVQNGHRFHEIPHYTLSQFEESARLADVLIGHQQARFIFAAYTAAKGDYKDVQKYIELINGK
jgi:hypothetical protein